MTKVIKKGGKRASNKLKYSTQRLLKVLWELKGGPHTMEKVTGEYAQAFIDWRNKGKVAFKQVGRISRLLKINKEALNYEEVGEYNGVNNEWETIVVKALGEGQKARWVLSAEHPKVYEGD